MKKFFLHKTLLGLVFSACLLTSTPTSVNAQDAFLGEIKMFAGNFAPRGWAFCEGQLMPISTYTTLYSILGTTYGGDGRTTFALPDLRGRAPIHAGQGPGLSHYPLGRITGTERVILTTSNLPSHSHDAQLQNATTTASIKASSTAGTSSVPGQAGATTLAATGTGRTGGPVLYNNETPNVELNTGSGETAVSGTVVVSSAGGSQPASNVQPVIAINYIICLEGTYPQR